ncbi:MAG: methyltransferase [Bacilli bacterium]|nr:methyltransferase [Bacilli bacterium]
MSIRVDFLPKHEDIKIYQDDEMFCINTDTMVLGEFLEVYRNDVVLDIGTNTGALMLYASLFNPRRLVGIDINQKALELAKKNMEENNVKNYELIHADGNTFRLDEEVDVVIFNPPYFKTPSKDLGNNEFLALAKHEDNFSLESMANCINRNLRNNGTLYFLFQTSRLNEVIKVFNNKKLIIKKLKFVYDVNKEYSNVVLIKAVKGAKEGLIVEKPIIIDRKK